MFSIKDGYVLGPEWDSVSPETTPRPDFIDWAAVDRSPILLRRTESEEKKKERERPEGQGGGGPGQSVKKKRRQRRLPGNKEKRSRSRLPEAVRSEGMSRCSPSCLFHLQFS